MFKNRLDETFRNLKKRKRKALLAYLAAGYPKFSDELKLFQAMEQEGVDVFEVGIPFSDPIADGPTIQYASQAALENGVSVKKILKWLGASKSKLNAPIVLMGYLNPLLAYGLKKFAADAQRAGVSGLIVPDLIPEESDEIRRLVNSKKIHLIHMVAPTTPKERQRAIARKTGGFLYAVSVAGVTGARKVLPKETKRWLANLKRLSPKPVCVGFGISGPDQIRHLRNSVDGFIVGSAMVNVVRHNNGGARVPAMRKFVRTLAKELSNGR
jgi:tryptophan synthase alpha chain